MTADERIRNLERLASTGDAAAARALLEERTEAASPRHEHEHCDGCRWLGPFHDFDLYFCPQNGLPTVIARFGPGGDYQSGLPGADILPELGEARRRARAMGLLP